MKTYIGFTQNVQERLIEHNSSQSEYSKKFVPWKIVFYAAFQTQQQAISFEKYLKTCSGRTFIKKHCQSNTLSSS